MSEVLNSIVAQEIRSEGAKLAKVKKHTLRLMVNLPRGIQIGMRTDGRPKPYFVRYGRERRVQSFALEAERNLRTQQLVDGIRIEGESVLEFDPSEWRDFKRLLLETGLSLHQIREIVLSAKGRGAVCLLVSNAIARYLPIREMDGSSPDTYSHMKKTLERWQAFAGTRTVDQIEPATVREWMTWLTTKFKFGPVTVRNYRKNLFTFFEWLRVELRARQDNPCEAVQPPSALAVKRRVLSIGEAHRLLFANRGHPIAPKLALEMFGGLRCASVERIQREHVMFDRRGVEMPAELHKSRKRQYRQGHPAVMWEWLALATDATWDGINAKNYDEKKAEAFIRAGIANPGNSLRHSFASYLLAHTKDFSRVGYFMQHTNHHTTQGYEGMANEHDARTYLTLTPCRVLMGLPEIAKTASQYLKP